jgi:hypothetical protein
MQHDLKTPAQPLRAALKIVNDLVELQDLNGSNRLSVENLRLTLLEIDFTTILIKSWTKDVAKANNFEL